MKVRNIGLALAVAVTALGVGAGKSDAAVAAIGATQFGGDAGIDQVRWVCGPVRCVWTPGAPGPLHPWARGWGPPRAVGCVWERRRGRWVQICV
jgi:hypothetical protein